MITAKEKRNKLALIEDIIVNEQFGLYNVSKNMAFTMPELSKIKKILLNKSHEKNNYEKELYYKISIKINLNNYLDYFKVLDEHIQKNNKQKKSFNNKEMILSSRKTAEIVVGVNDITDEVKMKLKKYIYLQTSSPKAITIYLRKNKDYLDNIAEIKEISRMLQKTSTKLDIKIVCESNIIKNMNPLEKKEFISFMKSY